MSDCPLPELIRALDRMRRANERGTGCHLTADMIREIGYSKIGELWHLTPKALAAFWLWHVLGDGFHVTRTFVEDLPIGPALFHDSVMVELRRLGQSLWQKVNSDPVVSCNRARTTIAFPASRVPEIQQEIDRIIINAARLPEAFLSTLDSFVRSVVAADPSGSFSTPIPEDIFNE